MENPFKRFVDAPVDEKRRDILKVAIPGGWIPELVRNGRLSPIGQASLGVDLMLLCPTLFVACGNRLQLLMEDNFNNPVYRAASLVLYNSKAAGQGCLIESGGTLLIYTIDHVADNISQGSRLNIRGVGDYSLSDSRLSYLPKHPTLKECKDARSVIYQPSSQIQQDLYTAIKKDVLKPLVLSRNPSTKGDTVAIAHSLTGRFIIYQNTGLFESKGPDTGTIYNCYVLTNGSDEIACGGQSGSPVLKVTNNSVTNEVVGLVNAVSIDRFEDLPYDDKAPCGQLVWVRPTDL